MRAHRIRDYFFPHKWWLITGFVFLIITSGIQLMIPMVVRFTVNNLEAEMATSQFLLQAGMLYLALTGIRAAARFAWRFMIFGTSRKIERNMRDDLYEHIMQLPVEFFGRRRIGDLMAISSNDIDAVRRAVGFGLLIALDMLVMLIGSIYFMAQINPRVTMLAILPMPFMAILLLTIGPRIRKIFTQVQESFAALTVTAEENVTGVRVVKAYCQEAGEEDRFRKSNLHYKKMNLKMALIDGAFHGVMFLLPSLSLVAILFFGGIEYMQGQLHIGGFLALSMYVRSLRMPMQSIGFIYRMIQRGRVSIKRIWDVLIEKTDFGQEESPGHIDTMIEFNDLTFSYPEHKHIAVKDFSLKVKKGETVAIMGRTGSGKSTIINLLLRLYDPPPGTVSVGGIDILDIPKRELRALFGTAPQEAFLFTNSIRENISFARSRPSDEEIQRVAESAHVYDDIMDMPDKLDTIIGERGITLSGGQRQRTSLARAFLADRKILILDDPLSAVDTVTEAGILRAIEREKKNRTVILVTNRVNAARMADRIVVIERGSIIEQGTEKELLRKNGAYTEVYKHQQFEVNIEKEP